MRTGTITAMDHKQVITEELNEYIEKHDNVSIKWSESKDCFELITSGIRGRDIDGWFVPDPGQLITYKIAIPPAEKVGAIIWDK
jgi:hypothetical protein